jgi:hypothetical protein
VPSRLTESELAQLISARLVRLENYHGAHVADIDHLYTPLRRATGFLAAGVHLRPLRM